MSWGDCIGWAVVVGIWVGVVLLLANVLRFTDHDPDERDPYD